MGEGIAVHSNAVPNLAPLNTLKLAQFMYKVGQIKIEPKSWKDYFFPDVHGLPGT